MEKLKIECSLDFPTLQYNWEVMVKTPLVSEVPRRFFVFYDYVLDDFFTLHPYKVNRAANSYLTEDFFEKAKKRSEDRLDKTLERYFHMIQGCSISSARITDIYPYITSYKFIGVLNETLTFEFDKLSLAEINLKNIYIEKANEKHVNVEKALKELYSRDALIRGLCEMGKMKFSYKDKSYSVDPVKFSSVENLSNGEEILLAKEYDNTIKNGGKILFCPKEIINKAIDFTYVADIESVDVPQCPLAEIVSIGSDSTITAYTPSELSVFVEFFKEYVSLPFNIARKLIGDEARLFLESAIKTISNSKGNNAVNAIVEITRLLEKYTIRREG